MERMKKLLLIATGGTIASKYTDNGLTPQVDADSLLEHVPEHREFCEADTIQPLNLDSTNIQPENWKAMAAVIEKHYEYYDGFVICHGTDTMAYTAAALSYLIQNNNKPIVITGAQKPIGFPTTDAKKNLLDSMRFAADDRAHGVNIVFGGQVIAGTRAKKERSHSYNAFTSINFPPIAHINDKHITMFIDDKFATNKRLRFYHSLDKKVILMKLVPGMDGHVLDALFDYCDAIIIESFGVGGLPNYGENSFYDAIKRFIDAGKVVVMATQVTHEGSDMAVYQVGKMIKSDFDLPESYDMTLEATVAKTMWALSHSSNAEEFKALFYSHINHDLLMEV